jgi:hypothetical protein
MAMIEGLESRVFLSVTPAPMLFNPTVRAQRLMVKADLLKFRSDIFACDAKLLRDRIAIRKDLAKGDTSLDASFLTLQNDVKTMRSALRVDRLTESANALADESVIKLDIRQIIRDRGNTTAEATDHTKLRADRIQLQNDLIAGLDSRIATRQAAETTISNDVSAIVTAANADPNASAALKAAAQTFATDRTTCLTTLSADLQAVAAARTTLVADLTAAQST